MTYGIVNAETLKNISSAQNIANTKIIVDKLKEIIIKKAYSGEYSGTVYLPPQTPLTIVKDVVRLFEHQGYNASYNTTLITLTWT